MAHWGKRKSDNQSYPKNKKSKLSRTGTTQAMTGKTIKSPKKPVLGKDFHIYRIFSYRYSDGGDTIGFGIGGGDSDEIAHIKAKNIDDAVKFTKKKFIKEEFQDEIQEDGDELNLSLSSSYAIDEDTGFQMNLDKLEKMQNEGRDDEIEWVTEGWNIIQDDDSEEDYQTIYGGNDFFDITESIDKPKMRGISSAEAIKFHGGIAPALFFGTNRINQKIEEDSIRKKYREITDAINNQPIPEKAKRVLISEMEAKMKHEILSIGRVPVGEMTAENFDPKGTDYGSGYGVR